MLRGIAFVICITYFIMLKKVLKIMIGFFIAAILAGCFLFTSNKKFFLELLEHVKSSVYREATIHNPPGDIFPDEIDDSLRNKFRDLR